MPRDVCLLCKFYREIIPGEGMCLARKVWGMYDIVVEMSTCSRFDIIPTTNSEEVVEDGK